MSGKKEEQPRQIYRGDPLWTVVLSQLKTQALCLAPFLQEDSSSADRALEARVGYQQFESFLSSIEDSYDLTRLLFLNKSNLRSVNFSQLVEDVGENYARRFGSLSTSSVFLLVDEVLPVAQTYPQIIMRIVDCLLRAAQRLAGEKGAQISLQKSKAKFPSPSQFGVVIRCSDFRFRLQTKRIEESLEKFQVGKYAPCIHDLGLDICAALHLACQMGASLAVFQDGNESMPGAGVHLEITFPFERSREEIASSSNVSSWFLWSESALFTDRLEKLAAFHGAQQIAVNALSEVPEGAPLIVDATECYARDSFLRQLPALSKNTIFLVSNCETDTVGKLLAKGFRNVIAVPVVSSKLLRSFESIPCREALPVSGPIKSEKPLRVLVVDDTETARIVIRDHLESVGHSVVEAFDGTEFIDLIQRGEHFDLVFCDLTMCHVDGLAAVRMVREHEKHTGAHLPVALMTAYSSVDNPKDALQAGVDFVLRKPLSGEDIDGIISRVQTPEAKQQKQRGPMQETQVLALDDLKGRCGGKTKTMIRVLESFLATSGPILLKLKSEEVRGNQVLLAKMLHTVKGLLREIAATDGAEALQNFETKLKEHNQFSEQDLKEVETWLESAAKAAETTKQKLQAEVQ